MAMMVIVAIGRSDEHVMGEMAIMSKSFPKKIVNAKPKAKSYS